MDTFKTCSIYVRINAELLPLYVGIKGVRTLLFQVIQYEGEIHKCKNSIPSWITFHVIGMAESSNDSIRAEMWTNFSDKIGMTGGRIYFDSFHFTRKFVNH